jgi:hypothetical protein
MSLMDHMGFRPGGNHAPSDEGQTQAGRHRPEVVQARLAAETAERERAADQSLAETRPALESLQSGPGAGEHAVSAAESPHGAEAARIPEADRRPEYAGAIAGLRDVVLNAQEPGQGLVELQFLLDQVKSAKIDQAEAANTSALKPSGIPAEVLLEVLGMAHTLDERSAQYYRDELNNYQISVAGFNKARQAGTEGMIPPSPPKPIHNDYEDLLGQLKHEIYEAPDLGSGYNNEILPDLVRKPLTGTPQEISWTGFPIQIREREAPGAAYVSTTEPALTVALGPEDTFVWHARSAAGPSVEIAPGQHQVVDGVNLANAAPHLEVSDPTGTKYVETFQYPRPDEVKRRLELRQARDEVEHHGRSIDDHESRHPRRN